MLINLASAPAATDMSLGDRVFPVAIGAVIALAGAVFVQLWLVPRVDTRKRREQRWEEDVLALGQLLTFDHPRTVSDLRSELHLLVLLANPPGDVDATTERWTALKAERREALRTARDEFDSLRTRVDWLADRIVSLAPHSKPLGHMAHLSRNHFLRHAQLGMLEWRPELENEPPLTEEAIDEAGDALAKVTSEMVKELKGLATTNPPRNSRRKRGRQLLAKMRTRRQRNQQPGSGSSPTGHKAGHNGQRMTSDENG